MAGHPTSAHIPESVYAMVLSTETQAGRALIRIQMIRRLRWVCKAGLPNLVLLMKKKMSMYRMIVLQDLAVALQDSYLREQTVGETLLTA
jgi:hypothetical protein